MILPRLSDVDPALLTTIGADTMLAFRDLGWLGKQRPRRQTRAEPDPAPEPETKQKHRKVAA